MLIVIISIVQITTSFENCSFKCSTFDLSITIGTISIRDNFNSSVIDSNSGLVISNQPMAGPSENQAEILIPGVKSMPMPNESFKASPRETTAPNEQSTSGVPSAPPAPIDFSESKH